VGLPTIPHWLAGWPPGPGHRISPFPPKEQWMPNFTIQVNDYEPFEKALRRFSVKTRKSGILRELKKKRFYTKPSVQRKMDIQKSIRRQKKAARLAAMSYAERRKEAAAKKTRVK
jgi:small subunit ribosomal protein S21